MIVVKTKATLRIKENKKNKLVPLGSVFRGRTIIDLPEWLQEHITYFRNTSRCNTLLIREHAEIEQPIAPKGVEKVKTVVKEVKTVKEATEPFPEPKKEVKKVVKVPRKKKAATNALPKLKKRTLK